MRCAGAALPEVCLPQASLAGYMPLWWDVWLTIGACLLFTGHTSYAYFVV